MRERELELSRKLTLDDIGQLIFEYRNRVELRDLDKISRRWIGPKY